MKLFEMVNQVEALLVTDGDYKTVESTLKGIVQLVRENPLLTEEFESAFLYMFENRNVYPILVVEYSMHWLRFDKIRARALERVKDDASRLDRDAWHVLDAYTPRWRLTCIFGSAYNYLELFVSRLWWPKS